MEHLRVGFAFCGSFCTYDKAMAALEQVRARYGDVTVSYTHLTLPTICSV